MIGDRFLDVSEDDDVTQVGNRVDYTELVRRSMAGSDLIAGSIR